MDFSKVLAILFGIVFIMILYVIIYYALKIMYKDVKGGGRRQSRAKRRTQGIEVIEVSIPGDLAKGAVIPIKANLSLGRKNDNTIVLQDRHVSSNHARLLIRNELLYIEDLNSTNEIGRAHV